VKATDGIDIFLEGVSEGTFLACELERQSAEASFIALGCTIISSAPCKPFLFEERFVPPPLEPELIKWPWPGPGPWCLSCPLLTEDLIDVIYPAQADRVRSLAEKYQIDAYNKELRQLQERYDLQGFEESMYRLENRQLLKR